MNAMLARIRLHWRDIVVYLAIAVITMLHYLAPTHKHYLHDIYRRLYYLPIIFAAFAHGWVGGLTAAVVVCALYAPHAFHLLGIMSHDPALPLQKVLEMVLYLAVGGITGSLVSRLKGAHRDLEGTIFQLRTTEAQLIQTAKLAAIGKLSAGLAHEIRNPLASIKGSAEILADDFPPDHPKRKLLQILIDESVRLNSVLSRFLAFARPRPLERSVFDMRAELDTLLALLQGQAAGEGVRFEVDPSPPIPVRGDREQLRQVLLNILLNASQSAGRGGLVRIHCAATQEMCRIVVHDSGPGFSADAMENAFTPFYTTKEQGTGLGLAVSHRIVELHGGRIAIRNHSNGGGVVECDLPLERS
jgi:two-component system, NtrC family, sensor histidine kinase HydH